MTEPRTTPDAASVAPTSSPRRTSPWVTAVGGFIFFSRWLQAPLYLGLIVAQAIYVIVFMTELWHLGEKVWDSFAHPGVKEYALEESTVMLGVLGLIDVVMIANLLIMVIIGGYETFVSRIRLDGHPDQPEWLSHVNANVLKVKLAMAIIGISSIHLLKTFIEVGAMTEKGNHLYTPQGVFWQVMIHLTFILSAVALAWIDRMSTKVHAEAHAAQAPAAPLEPRLPHAEPA